MNRWIGRSNNKVSSFVPILDAYGFSFSCDACPARGLLGGEADVIRLNEVAPAGRLFHSGNARPIKGDANDDIVPLIGQATSPHRRTKPPHTHARGRGERTGIRIA